MTLRSAPNLLPLRIVSLDLAGSTQTQVAVVRMLTDEVEHAIAAGQSERWTREQLVEELARFGSRLIDLAAAMGPPLRAEGVPAQKDDRIAAGAAP